MSLIMPRYCAIPWCRASDEKKEGRRFHKFPTDKERFKKWCNFISGDFNWKPKNSVNFICSDHFSGNMKWNTGRLVKDAVPGRYLSD